MEAKILVVDPTQKVDYSSGKVPTSYCCSKCNVVGVKLWREYQTFLSHQSLLCAKCSGVEQKEDISSIDEEGQRIGKIGCGRTDQIGWRVPAVPTEGNNTFWGYFSIPEAGVQWWKKLPTFLSE